MNKIFLPILAVLIVASIITCFINQEKQLDHIILSWKSDPNPQRYEQTELFATWLKTHHSELFKDGKLPFEVAVDVANNQSTLIQAVSGVGGDIIDGVEVPVFYSMGLLQDLDKYAKAGNFSLDTTYKGIEQKICSYNGVQAGYPCNISVVNFWVNLDVFNQYGIEIPSENITIEEFERIGKEFMQKANSNPQKPTRFFCQFADYLSAPLALINIRSHGVDFFNETLTKPTLDTPELLSAFETIYRWINVDKIMPSASDITATAATSAGGYGGGGLSQFILGNYGIVHEGRYSLIRMREANQKVNLASIQLPQSGDFRNMIINARASTMYKGSKNAELSKYFFEFLASKEYNNYIIKYGDGLPPTPKYALDNPEYESPTEYPNEGNVHKNELKWAIELAYARTQSPYYIASSNDLVVDAFDKYLNNRLTAKEAIVELENKINLMITQTLIDNAKLNSEYQENLKIQAKIDEYKKQGKKIPVAWIKNNFYKNYYLKKGMLDLN